MGRRQSDVMPTLRSDSWRCNEVLRLASAQAVSPEVSSRSGFRTLRGLADDWGDRTNPLILCRHDILSTHTSPMTYLVNGRRHVAIAAGGNILSFALRER